MAYSRISTKKSTISKPCGNQGKQKSKEVFVQTTAMRQRRNLVGSVRRYLRRKGCWPKL